MVAAVAASAADAAMAAAPSSSPVLASQTTIAPGPARPIDQNAAFYAIFDPAAVQDAIALGESDAAPEATCHVVRCDGDAESQSARRLAAPERVDTLAKGRVGREGQVEALTDPVGVETDQVAAGVEQRTAR